MANPYEVELLTVQYTEKLQLLLQQRVSKLRGLVDSGSHVGSAASPIQQTGVLEFKAPAGRGSPLQYQVPNFVRRWLTPNDRELPTISDSFDRLKSIVDPRASLGEAVQAAAGRYFDDLIIACAFDSAAIGVAASTGTESWPASTYVVADTFGSASTVGLTTTKIAEGRRILEHYQNDLDAQSVTLIVGSQQNANLLEQTEITSADYNSGRVMESGKVRHILGTDIVHSERLATGTYSTNACRRNIMFVRDGLYLGIWKDMSVNIDEAVWLSGRPWQLVSMLSAGATRTQLGKVIEIRSYDTTSVDPTAP